MQDVTMLSLSITDINKNCRLHILHFSTVPHVPLAVTGAAAGPSDLVKTLNNTIWNLFDLLSIG